MPFPIRYRSHEVLFLGPLDFFKRYDLFEAGQSLRLWLDKETANHRQT